MGLGPSLRTFLKECPFNPLLTTSLSPRSRDRLWVQTLLSIGFIALAAGTHSGVMTFPSPFLPPLPAPHSHTIQTSSSKERYVTKKSSIMLVSGTAGYRGLNVVRRIWFPYGLSLSVLSSAASVLV